MPVTWTALALIIGCGLAFSCLDLLRKVLGRSIRPMALLVYLAAGEVPLFLVWVLWFHSAGPRGDYWLPATASIVLNFLANLAYLEAVRLSPLSLTVPFLSLTPVFATLLAIPILGEVPGPLAFLGIALVVAGALRLNLPPRAGNSPRVIWRSFSNEKGSVLMVAVAFFWSLALPLDKISIARSSPAFHGLVLNCGIGLGAFLLLVRQHRGAELSIPRRRQVQVVAAIVASTLGLALQLFALAVAWAGLVETLKRAIGSTMAILLGFLIFGEPISWPKVIAVLLLAVGVALVLH
ncbi:MAG TPA: DMT family transporter [Thermoanaerobaculia bacterium]|nr:DMT family transporter [Thermoanaerobaculia bacterium]